MPRKVPGSTIASTIGSGSSDTTSSAITSNKYYSGVLTTVVIKLVL